MDKDKKTTEVSENNEAVENLTLQGNCVFLIETVAAGIAVQTALLTEDKNIHIMPAVFPTLQYALQQIDELRTHIINHFSNAAQIGAKVIADNAAQNAAQVANDADAIDDKATKTDAAAVTDKSFKKAASY
jgi:hypothetical protein